MKLHILLENLQKKLSFVNKAISTKSQLPILLNVLLETKEGILRISSTDLEIGIITEIPAIIEEEGGTTIPAKTFIDLINSLPVGKVFLETKAASLEVSTEKTKNVFQTISKEDFPRLYEEKGEALAVIKKEMLQKDFSKVIFAASSDTERPALSGVYMKRENNGFLLVATDGYRLSLKRHVVKTKTNEQEQEEPLLIPARVFKEITGLKDQEGDINIYVSKKNNQVLFEENGTILVGRLIEAKFPAYEKIIPEDHATRAFFDREEMYQAIKICAIFAKETANIIRFTTKDNAITVSTNGSLSGQNTVEVEAKVVGDEVDIAFNARYLLDLFSNITEKEIVLEMTGPLSPGVFKIKDDSSFLHLIMPIRVQE